MRGQCHDTSVRPRATADAFSPLLEHAGVPHLFTTRSFPGVTAFRDPFPPLGPEAQPLLAEHGLGAEPAAFLKQVHGAQVLRATGGGCAGKADVLMTDRPGLPIAVFSADCVPLLIYDPDGRRLAVVHAGWRGTAQSAARAAVLALVEAGGRPEGFLAAVGPSIGPCCRGVDKPVIARPRRGLPGVRLGQVDGPEGVMLDLWAANSQLRAQGSRRQDRQRHGSARVAAPTFPLPLARPQGTAFAGPPVTLPPHFPLTTFPLTPFPWEGGDDAGALLHDLAPLFAPAGEREIWGRTPFPPRESRGGGRRKKNPLSSGEGGWRGAAC